MEMERLYKVSELAKLLNVGRSTVISWIHRGKIRAIRIVGTWRIPESEVQKLLRGEVRE